MRSSRIETEKKGKVTSLRLTEEQSALLHSKAAEKGMSLSNYIITAAINSETSLDIPCYELCAASRRKADDRPMEL